MQRDEEEKIQTRNAKTRKVKEQFKRTNGEEI